MDTTNANAVRWELLPASEFARHRGEWESVRRSHATAPVLQADFVESLLEVFGHEGLLLAVARRDGDACALAIVERVGRLAWQTWQPSQAPLGPWVHVSGLTWEALLPGLLRALPGFPLIFGVTQCDPRWVARPVDFGPFLTQDYIASAQIILSGTFDQFWEQRDKKVRYETTRRLRRLAEQGVEPRLEVVTDPAAIPEAVAQFGLMESSGWKGSQGTAIHPANRQGVFYRSVLEKFCRNGRGIVYRYWLGNQIAAMQLCIVERDTLVFLKTTFDEALRAYSPGILMKVAIIRRLFEEGAVRQVEFYGNLKEWQIKWSTGVKTLYHLNCYRWSWLAALRGLRHDGAAWSDRKGLECAAAGMLVKLPVNELEAGRQNTGTSIFATPQWYRHLIATGLAPTQGTRFFLEFRSRRESHPAMVWPMRFDKKGLARMRPHSLRALANYYTSLYEPIRGRESVSPGSAALALATAIRRDSIRWDMVDLHPLDTADPLFAALGAAFRHCGFLVQHYFCFGNWYLPVAGRSYHEYLSSLPSQLRNTMKRRGRQLRAAHGVEMEIITGGDRLEPGIAAYEKVYGASWKQREPFPEFIPGMARMCARNGWLRLGVLWVDEQPAAAQLWIVHNRKALIYKLAYDEKFAKFSVGTLLTARLMEHVLDVDKVDEVDFLTGDDAYKRDWMSHRRERWGITAFNARTLPGLGLALLHFFGPRMRKLLQRRAPAAAAKE